MLHDLPPHRRSSNRQCMVTPSLERPIPVLLVLVLSLMVPIAVGTSPAVAQDDHTATPLLIPVQSSSEKPSASGKSAAADQLAAEDQIVLINTRGLGLACESEQLQRRLRCERYDPNSTTNRHWQPTSLEEVLTDCSAQLPTIIYVHGNRIARGTDRSRGLMVYRSLIRRSHPTTPIRFVIWSWPSAKIPGALQDYRVKAARTRPAGWQLAWFVDRMPADTPLSLIGYSYGARVVSGCMHLLGGGRLNGLKLEHREHPERTPVRAVFVAAAFDMNWMLPGGYHGKALSQIEQLMLLNNRHDPAMRFFHFSTKRQRIQALGWAGMPRTRSLGKLAGKIASYDVTAQVGRTHSLHEYLSASQPLSHVWRQVCYKQPSVETTPSLQPPAANQAALAGR